MALADSSLITSSLKGVIFDLDGVLVDTARFHDKAWAELAIGLGYSLTEEDRHALKGRSRTDSLEYLLERARWHNADPGQKSRWLQAKNARYLELVEALTPENVFPSAFALLDQLRRSGIRLALGSSSQNSAKVLQKIGLERAFDSVVDGTRTSRSKPDPHVFLIAASDLGLEPLQCAVIEDADAGVQAAVNGGFLAVGLGDASLLAAAHRVISSLSELSLEVMKEWHLTFYNNNK
jgi:beta-phosphoglucomutase